MTRITTTIAIVLILINSSSVIMAASGLNEDLGVALAPGVSNAVDQMQSEVDSISPSAGAGNTLFTLFITAFQVLNVIFNAALAAPQMMMNVGFPAWVVVPLAAPAYVVAGLELLYALTGRDLV